MSSSSSPSPSPAPVIGKIGPYTVFLTPPPPSPSPSPRNAVIQSPTPPTRTTEYPIPASPRPQAVIPPPQVNLPPVIPPPAQYMRPDEDRFGFFWTAVARVQHVHSRVDEYVANWLGLNQSKYQWALDDFYEAKGVEVGKEMQKQMKYPAKPNASESYHSAFKVASHAVLYTSKSSTSRSASWKQGESFHFFCCNIVAGLEVGVSPLPPHLPLVATMSSRNRDKNRDRDRDTTRDRDSTRDHRDRDREIDRRRDKDDRDHRDRDRRGDHRDRTRRSPTPDRTRSRHTRSPLHHRSSTRRTPSRSPSRPRRSDDKEGSKAAVSEKPKKNGEKEEEGEKGGGEGDKEVDADEVEMMKNLGIPTWFDSTKGKPVPGANVSGVRVVTKRQPRQYMNRRGGFNRPLPAEVNR
ncbi:U4/U6.U5 small nuclear ribonucleoprotein 27 kDa protein-like protein [Drosera capensis]